MRRLIWCLSIVLLATPVLAAEPASVPAPLLQAGDAWVYDQTHELGANGFSQLRVDLAVERVGSDTMVIGIKPDGAPRAFQDHIAGLDWSMRRIIDGKETITGRPFLFPLTVGATWTADYAAPTPHGLQTSAHFHTTYKVVGWTDITVPAGTFHALKIQGDGTAEGQMAASSAVIGGATTTVNGATAITHAEKSPARTVHVITYDEFYYSPEVKYYVKSIEEQYDENNVRTKRDTWALVSFKVAP